MRKTILSGIITVVLVITLYGQQKNDIGSPFIEQFTSEDYKGGSVQNWDITQDNRGMMYFGNGVGILRFDGKNWDTLPVKNKTAVRTLGLSPEGIIYAGAINDLGYVGYDNKGKWEYRSLVELIPEEHRNFGDIINIEFTNYGVYFFTVNSILIYHNNTFEIIEAPNTIYSSIVKNNTIFTYFTKTGFMAIKDNSTFLLPHSEIIPGSPKQFVFLLSYSEDTLLISGSAGRFFLYDLSLLENKEKGSYNFDNKDIPDSIIKEIQTPNTELLASLGMNQGVLLDNSTFVFATNRGGILVTDDNFTITLRLDKNRGVPDDLIIGSIFIDRNKNLWSIYKQGITHIYLNSPLSVFDKRNGIEQMPLDIHKLDGWVYACTADGLYSLQEERPQFTDPPAQFTKIHDALYGAWDSMVINDTLIAASFRMLIAAKKDTAQTIFVDDTLGMILRLGESSRFPDHLFLGTQTSGLGIMKIKNPGTREIPDFELITIIEELAGQMIFNITQDDKGDLWITAYSNGLWHLRFTGDDVTQYELNHYSVNDGLPDMLFNTFYNFKEAPLIATSSGFRKLVAAEDGRYVFKNDTTFGSNLDTIDIFHAFKDGEDRLWLVTGGKANLGIIRLDEQNQGDPILNNIPMKQIPIDVNNVFIEDGSVIWLASSTQLVRFDTKRRKNYSARYDTLITKVIEGREHVISYGTDLPDNTALPVFKYEKNSLAFEYIAPWFENRDATRYSYKLEGFDKEWSSWSASNRVDYTNLPENTYTFQVKAKNIFDMESSTATYSFKITAPWYRTSLAYTGYILLLSLFVFLMIKLYTYRLIAAKEKLEKLVEERTRDLRAEKKKSDQLLQNILPPMIAERLKKGEQRIINNYKKVTVLFADIVGFTEMASQYPPDELVSLLNELFLAFDILISTYEIRKIKTIGDSYMSAGGLSLNNEDDNSLHNTACLALDMLKIVHDIKTQDNKEMSIRIGIHVGPVVAGVIGTKRFSYDIWGDTVNIASRMESHGETNKIQVSEEVYKALKDDFIFEYRGITEIRGKGNMKTYFLTGKKRGTSETQGVSENTP